MRIIGGKRNVGNVGKPAAVQQPLPVHLRKQVDNELEAGEKVEWIEMPIPRFFTMGSTAMFLFAIPWTAFAVFWMFGASGFEIPDFEEGFDFFPLFGVPFVLVGLSMLLSPLWAYRKALQTIYVVTDRRAITFDGGLGTTVRSYPPEKLLEIHRKQHRDGSGNVIFAQRAWRDSDGDRRSEDLGFVNVRNPKQVERILRNLAGQVS